MSSNIYKMLFVDFQRRKKFSAVGFSKTSVSQISSG